MKKLRFVVAQKNFTVGGILENVDKISSVIKEAEALSPDFIVFPELSIVGYPPEDLLLKQSFIKDNMEGLDKVIQSTKGGNSVVIVGFVDMTDDIYNSAAVIQNGKLLGVYHKILLPNYGVFDEKRYFASGDKPMVVNYGGVKIGVSVCEDIWVPDGPVVDEVNAGSMILINISSSPYHLLKGMAREEMLKVRASDSRAAIVYSNSVGGQDELVFDGHSVVIDESGKVIARAPDFEESVLVCDISIPNIVGANLHDPRKREREKRIFSVEFIEASATKLEREPIVPTLSKILPIEEEIFKALTVGVRDYVKKNGFSKVVIGLSGGIDSSLVATVAVEALGAENVTGILMPSMYSSTSSVGDAQQLASKLGIKTFTIPISNVYNAYSRALKSVFSGTQPDVTEENLQARIRGNYLMALSNKFGWLVLTTGNKSEMSVGYATLYGDMAGGFAVIKDLYKTLVYRVAKWYNSYRGKEIIPNNVFVKPPSAELRPNQTDQDSLPPYDILDKILKFYVEDDLSFDEIVENGFDDETVKKVIKLVDHNEYKRRQAPPGIKITTRAFGRDRRLPITNHYQRRG